MDTTKNIRASLKKLQGKIKSAKEISEEDLRVAFVKSGILEVLGYEGELKDVRFEKGVRGKRSDLLAFDDYQNVVFVVEFKRPNEIDLEQDFAQLWERYVKPLRARYGVLTDGLELLIYEQINSNWERKLRVNLDEVTLSQCEELSELLKKPSIERTKINEVLRYFERFDKPEERVNLSSEIAQQHFFDSFELKEDSIFVNLVQKTIGLFDFELERSKFLKSAYNFWRISYAKKPERVPENWRRIMDEIGLETNEENLFKFMFCLESAYSLFTRLILAKACEDYKLPDIDFSGFIKNQIRNISFRGDISLMAWAITTRDLIESMKQKLVKSVFEGDIFYWWEDSYKELSAGESLYSPRYEKQKAYFGEALADIILTLYKFDFSEIVGDPLGTLYQHYFDKETRKALGEFYTPKEVVEYILDAVGYDGRGVIGKKLLDPACGSGTFLVEALRRYLKASEQLVEEKGWPGILKELCNEYRIVGFDIHPFATFMAQMQFMLVLIPAYKKAMDKDPHFVLNRLPIFRTDSLIDERKGGKVTLKSFENGTRYIDIDTMLPIGEEALKIRMPYDKDAISDRTGLYNTEEYFAALQAVFDTVKKSAWQEKYAVDKEKLERNFKRYLIEKEWSGLVSFFTPYAEHFLQKFEELKVTFGDGKLIKSIEDIMLAAILKNYVKYDFVVGNPPYVRIQTLASESKEKYEAIYTTISGNYDIYIPFIERGITWLNDSGRLGYINPNRFATVNYGRGIREYILQQTNLLEFLDFRDTGVFKDALNYPVIIILEKRKEGKKNLSKVCRLVKKPETKSDTEILTAIKENFSHIGYIKDYCSGEFFDAFGFDSDLLNADGWYLMPTIELEVFKKLIKTSFTLNSVSKTQKTESALSEGSSTGAKKIYVLEKVTDVNENYVLAKSRYDNNQYKIERTLLKQYIEDAGKWYPKSTNEFLIFPYRKSNETYELIPEAELQNNYPLGWDYLNSKKDTLLKRKDIRNKALWYAYSAPRSLDYYEEEKILVQGFSVYSSVSIDLDGSLFFGPDIYGLRIKEVYKDQALLVLAILNSHVTNFYTWHVGVVHGSGYYKFEDRFLKQLPIRLPQTSKDKTLADEIMKKVEQIIEKAKFEQKIENFPGEYIQDYRSKGEEFDPPKNISFNSNQKAFEPVIEKTVDGRGYNIVIGKREKSVYIESKIKADYAVAALKGKRTKKDEKLQLLIPKSDTIVEEILKKLEEDNAKTKSPSVAELEEEINELVYKLYGLNEKDVKVIEDFLRRF